MSADPDSQNQPIRVMLVDDSAVVRGLMSRALQKEPRIHIVASASDGDMAISVLQRNSVDVILLDIEMPNKDGLEALPILLAIAPNAHVIMVSSLTQRNAEISMKALELGAADYIPKPMTRGNTDGLDVFYRELSDKVISLGEAAQQNREMAAGALASAALNELQEEQVAALQSSDAQLKAKAIAIASSTGGPQALLKLLTQVKEPLANVPVFITQHMPTTFTALLAQHLSSDTGLDCREGQDGELVKAGRVYIAPGDYHMFVEESGSDLIVRLNQEPAINFCRPSADPMFNSLAHCYGENLLGLVLTGMGHDGRDGARTIKEAGGRIIVQDRESSVVWGMPGAIATAQLQDAILSLDHMADYVKAALEGSS